MGMLIQPDARLADGELRDEVRCFEGEEVEEVPLPLLVLRGGPMVGTDILMDRLRASLPKPVASLATRPTTTGSMVGRRRPPRLL
jgi:hypothetical protein